MKKSVLKNFTKFAGIHLCQFLAALQKAQVFYCGFCEISKNTFFTEHLWMTASVNENTIFSFIIYLAQVKALNFTLKHAKASSNK